MKPNRSPAAVAYLEEIQEKAYRFFGFSHPSTLASSDEAMLRRILSAATGLPPGNPDFELLVQQSLVREQAEREAVPTRFENARWYGVLEMLSREIENVFVELGREVPLRPLLGTLRTGQVNAMAIAVPDSDAYIIVFDDGLFPFANLMSKAVASTIGVKTVEGKWCFELDEESWRTALRADRQPIHRLFDAITAYLLEGHPHAARPYLLDTPHTQLASILGEGMELFVLGHEYGHLVSGHLSPENLTRGRVGMTEADVIALNYAEEFEADTRGVELMVNALLKRGLDLPLSFWSVDFFFACIDVVEQAVSILRFGEKRVFRGDTHPPTDLRREATRQTLLRSAPEEQASAAIRLADAFDGILDEMFAEIEPMLMELHRKAPQLAPGWGK